MVKIYTMGVCYRENNPNKVGGWGAVLVSESKTKEISGIIANVTFNKISLIACIEALKSVKTNQSEIILCTNCMYIFNIFRNKHYKIWQSNGWITKAGSPVKHKDEWKELIMLVELLNVTFMMISDGSDRDNYARARLLADKAVEDFFVKCN